MIRHTRNSAPKSSLLDPTPSRADAVVLIGLGIIVAVLMLFDWGII